MKQNVGRLDQFIRIFIGLSLLAYIVKDGILMPGWPLLGLAGIFLIGTAFLSYCLLYDWLDVSSKDRPNHRIE